MDWKLPVPGIPGPLRQNNFRSQNLSSVSVRIEKSSRKGYPPTVVSVRVTDLDKTDLEILRLLREDGRRPYSDIGDAVGLSGPAVAARVDRLTEHGVLRGFTVSLDRSQLVGGTTVLVELEPLATHTEAVAERLTDAEATERVLILADGTVVAFVRVPNGTVRSWVASILEEPIPEYSVRLVEDEEAGDELPIVGFDVECAECGNTVTTEGTSARLDDERYHFCCESCETRFVQQYEELAEGV